MLLSFNNLTIVLAGVEVQVSVRQAACRMQMRTLAVGGRSCAHAVNHLEKTALNEKVEAMTDETCSFVSVHRLSNRFEADVLVDALKREGIPVILRTFEETPYDGLFISQRGYGLILVPEETVQRAKEILKPLLGELEACDGDGFSAVDPHLWERLREADPDEVCRNAAVRYDADREAYIVPYLDAEFLCFPEREQIESFSLAPFHRIDFQFGLVLLHYLLEAVEVPSTGRWIGTKDIPGGETFFRGPHSFPVEPLVRFFAFRPEALESASARLGGRKIEESDLSLRFQVFPRIPALLVFWRGDEEFETSLRVLFDETIIRHMGKPDLIWALVNVLFKSLLAAGRSLPEGRTP